ncbi:MAG: hypothetical protein L0287_32805, partial [Anaerolineae bacterium]|nr:hypothetical protein [Anaerolineae bacterium]
DGNFATWIGHAEKNAAWDHLSEAREALAHLFEETQSESHAARQSLGAAEGSDWMWWFGDTHFSAQAEEFDRLFRSHLINAYRLAGLPSPSALESPIRHRKAHFVHMPTGPIHPKLDGKESSYYEWLFAGWIDLQQQYSAIQRGEQRLRYLYYGFDDHYQYLRIDPYPMRSTDAFVDWTLDLLVNDIVIKVDRRAKASAPQNDSLYPHHIQIKTASHLSHLITCAWDRIIELAIPFEALQAKREQSINIVVSLMRNGEIEERYPAQGVFELATTPSALAAQTWSV